MFRFVTVATLVALASGNRVNDPAKLARINAEATTWVAGETSRFETHEDVKALCGTFLRDAMPSGTEFVELPEMQHANAVADDAFDARTAWPACSDLISTVRDQSSCGSCWAFGSTEALNDRRCIATNDTTFLSTEDTTACCGFLQCQSMGCNGGQPTAAWRWFASQGVVTGGLYDDADTCLPYSMAPCAHHVPASEKYPACPEDEYPTPRCAKKCSNGDYPTSYSSDKKLASSAYALRGEDNIKTDLAKHGPVTAAFTVYDDFPNYKSGVYQHTSGAQPLGGHAIEIVGWGEEGATPYWIVKNSWNEQWGDGGYFKILRGSNECGIEGQASGGTVGEAAAKLSLRGGSH